MKTTSQIKLLKEIMKKEKSFSERLEKLYKDSTDSKELLEILMDRKRELKKEIDILNKTIDRYHHPICKVKRISGGPFEGPILDLLNSGRIGLY